MKIWKINTHYTKYFWENNILWWNIFCTSYYYWFLFYSFTWNYCFLSDINSYFTLGIFKHCLQSSTQINFSLTYIKPLIYVSNVVLLLNFTRNNINIFAHIFTNYSISSCWELFHNSQKYRTSILNMYAI